MSQLSVEEELAPVKAAELETEPQLSASSAEMVITSNAGLELHVLNLAFSISQPLSEFVFDHDLNLDSSLTDVSINMDSLTYP